LRPSKTGPAEETVFLRTVRILRSAISPTVFVRVKSDPDVFADALVPRPVHIVPGALNRQNPKCICLIVGGTGRRRGCVVEGYDHRARITSLFQITWDRSEVGPSARCPVDLPSGSAKPRPLGRRHARIGGAPSRRDAPD
jgi:hypothetical protein